MRYLLIIDMQEDYVGTKRDKKKYPYDTGNLIKNINERINKYPAESVIYVTNRFFWKFGKMPKKLVEGLNIVSNNVYEKKKNSCFSNKELLTYLQKMKANELEIVGVDGNYCVASSALDGARKMFTVYCNESCIGVKKIKKFSKVKMILNKESVGFIC